MSAAFTIRVRSLRLPSPLSAGTITRMIMNSAFLATITILTGIGVSGCYTQPPFAANLRQINSARLPKPLSATNDPATIAWERSVRAGYVVPFRGRAVVSRWEDTGGAPEQRTEINVIADGAGRYRNTYLQPEATAGRIVLSDGETNYQYEPDRNTILQRKEVAPDTEEIRSPPHLLPQFVPDSAVLLGRPTRLLVTTAQGENGKEYLWEKRWIDTATDRSLKTETYSSSGRLIRRFQLTSVSFPASVSRDEFLPDFPVTARTIAATTPKSQHPVAEADRLGLPQEAYGFRLQSVARPLATRPGSSERVTHLIYSDGARAISLFVADVTGASPSDSRPLIEDWDLVHLTPGIIGYSRQSRDQAYSIVVWTQNGFCYTAVSQCSREEFLPVIRAFCIRANP